MPCGPLLGSRPRQADETVSMHYFKTPQESLGNFGADAAAALIAAAADIALVMNESGVILDIAFSSGDLTLDGSEAWIGQPWIDTVTVESRPKIEALLADAPLPGPKRRRQVNHPAPRGGDIPVLYSTLKAETAGHIIALGRDLRPLAAAQQRLVDAQQSVERDYARLRHMETRYRMLFQSTVEAVLVVEISGNRIVEANPMARQLFGDGTQGLIGRRFPVRLTEDSTQAVQTLLENVRISGQVDDVRVRLADGGPTLRLMASLFRQDRAEMALLRFAPQDSASRGPSDRQMMMLSVLSGAPDAMAVTSADGRILAANPSFLDMAQLANEDQARGESLDRWLGRHGVDVSVLMANLREHGSVRLFVTTLRGEHGLETDVEISAVSVDVDSEPRYGFAIRDIGRRLVAGDAKDQELFRSAEQLIDLVGRVPLKDIVRETTDVIERKCIEAALNLTHGNRASAAEMLGLSRQSLYVKLRRHGLDNGAAEDG